ncbi:MAG: helicase-related protein [Deltaproteobacteria bacterium]|nr:helicase-related protein [Deltaproteobacteria bacterium]
MAITPLPIDAIVDDVVAALRRGPAVVVQAPPGAGKTTRLPPALLAAGVVGDGKLLLLEPRRIAARAAALTMARQHDEPVGRTFGYQVRFERKESAATRILVVTEGILTRRFSGDPFLEGISVVVLDEFHERSVHTDLCLALLRELMHVREELKVVVMSATLDAAAVSAFLGDCPVVTSSGRPYPVTIKHLEKKARDSERPLEDRVAGAVRDLLARSDDDGGDVLCFLPGAPEIRRVQERLQRDPLPDPQGRGVDVVPLFGALSSSEQDRALFRPAGSRVRRVVLATNVAETSLTIDGVTSVVDTGLMKSVRYDPRADRERLELVKISQSSAEQRAGRAGRTRPGRALRLWTLAEHQQLPTSHPPEIHRTELSRVLLDVALFTNACPRAFRFFEAPPKANMEQALGLLHLLGALDDAGKPTAHGAELARLPLSPRAAAVLLAAAHEDIVDDAALAMALLEDDRALSQLQPRGQAVRTDSDLQVLLERAMDDSRLREVHASAKELQRLVPSSSSAASGAPALRLKRALLAGFPDRLCRRRRSGEAEAVMVGQRGVRLASESGVVDAELFLALSLEGQGASSLVRVAEAIDIGMLTAVSPHALRTVDEAILDEERGAFTGVRRTRFADLIISEKSGVAVDDDALALGLAAAFADRFERLFRPGRGAGPALTGPLRAARDARRALALRRRRRAQGPPARPLPRARGPQQAQARRRRRPRLARRDRGPALVGAEAAPRRRGARAHRGAHRQPHRHRLQRRRRRRIAAGARGALAGALRAHGHAAGRARAGLGRASPALAWLQARAGHARSAQLLERRLRRRQKGAQGPLPQAQLARRSAYGPAGREGPTKSVSTSTSLLPGKRSTGTTRSIR